MGLRTVWFFFETLYFFGGRKLRHHVSKCSGAPGLCMVTSVGRSLQWGSHSSTSRGVSIKGLGSQSPAGRLGPLGQTACR